MIRLAIATIRLDSPSGSFTFEDVCRSAIVTAMEHCAQVHFTYEGKQYVVRYHELINLLKGQ